MILYGTGGQMASNPQAKTLEHRTSMAAAYWTTSASSPPPPADLYFAEQVFDLFKPQAHIAPMTENFDWSNGHLYREYINLEQKVLAKVADREESRRYAAMKRDRNSQIFADRYFQDYEEIQRLKKLSQKIAELQQYLRPIPI
jgi:hypothetical protein